jgi:alanine racemase
VNRGAVAEIHLSAIAHNLQVIRKIVRNLPVIAVVKADAYGHGSVAVSEKLVSEGISCLAVAFINEAITLREAGIHSPVMVLFEGGDVDDLFRFQLIPVVSSVKTARLLSRKAQKTGKHIDVHVMIDTGMGRLGLNKNKAFEDLCAIENMQGISLRGVLSHFSDADLSDRTYAIYQLNEFNSVRKAFYRRIGRKVHAHIANSAAVLTFQGAYLDAVRPGIMLYGYSPLLQRMDFGSGSPPDEKHHTSPRKRHRSDLQPAMSVKTRILSVRTVEKGTPISYGRTFFTKRRSRIGVLPIGYADGYSRLFSNNSCVIVKGKKVPVVGRVCMDLTMIDLTGVKGVAENDEVVLMGSQGQESIYAEELAERARTIPYEILTALGSSSVKVHV